MHTNIVLCTKENSFLIENLCQFYQYELNTHSNLASFTYKNGRYETLPYFERYWIEKNRYPYCILCNDELAGFAFVHNITVNTAIKWKLSEFFVMAPFQRQGIAKHTLTQIFNHHPGSFEISVLRDNTPALRFWDNTLHNTLKSEHIEHPNYVYYEIDPLKQT